MDAGNRHTLLVGVRAGLLVMGLLLPLNAPFSIPPVGETKMFGWDSRPAPEGAGVAAVVTHTMRHAYTRGLRPGDAILRVNGEAASAAAVARARRLAAPGDTLELVVRRGADTVVVRVPVAANTAGFSGYFWYRVGVAVLAWAMGMALVAWRGGRPAGLVLGAALMLLAPITLPSGVPAQGPILQAARVGWQLQAAAHRFLLPALLLQFVALYLRRPRWASHPGLWWAVYLGLVMALGVVTDGFRDPMAWGELGPARGLRTLLGLPLEALAFLAAIASLRGGALPRSVRWLALAILVLMGAAAVRSASVVLLGEERVHEFVWRLEGLALILLPAAAFRFFAEESGGGEGSWHARRRLASSVSVLLTVVYGVAIAGTAAVVLSSTGRSLDGAEWLLFAALFLASLFFSPLLRWGGELVDRRMFARWAELELRAHGFVDRVSAELEPARIARRVEDELPELFDVPSARLVLALELANAWQLGAVPGLATAPRATIQEEVRACRETGRDDVVPIFRPDGELMGALLLGRRPGGRPFEPPERAVVRTVAQGIAAALRNAETYLALHRAQRELAESERIASLGALAGGLAHEIKNPLASLKMGLHLLCKDGLPGERIRRIARDVQRIDDLVSGLLRLTRGDVAEAAEPVDVTRVARACVDDARTLAEDRGIALAERYPPEPVLVYGGPNQIRLILSNLLSNAIDASGEGDAVRVEVLACPETVEILIRDTGPGVPDGVRDRIFALDYSTKPAGTGLGLALARRETERLGGTIEAVPGGERGTTLRVRLPRVTV